MALNTVNVGTTANDNTGDPIRTAFQTINDNFSNRLRGNYTPATSKGVTGDTIGDLAWDTGYIYICTVTWTDGVSDIWSRTAITAVATW